MRWLGLALMALSFLMLIALLTGSAHAQPIHVDEMNGGGGSSPLVAVAMRYVGSNPTGRSHKWCGTFLDLALRQSGHSGGGDLARGYSAYGRPSPARVGAIAVMAHHVGIVTAVGPGYVTLVSGNHSGRSGHRTVGLGRYSMARIIAFRYPA